MNKNTAEEIYSRNYGSEQFFKRDYYDELFYTEGIMDFQKTLNAYWVVDTVISYMPKVIKTSKTEDDGFFVVTIKINADNRGIFEIYREGWINNKYNEHITVVKQEIPYIDLPIYDYKFYLILSHAEPIRFTLILTSEYW